MSLFSLESWLSQYFNKNSGRRCRPRPTKVSLKPQGEEAPVDTLQTLIRCLLDRQRLKESFNVFRQYLRPPMAAMVADGGHGRRWTHLNRQEEKSPWIFKSSPSDPPETGNITLFHQTLTHSSSLQITAA